jgi:hypothetical protein
MQQYNALLLATRNVLANAAKSDSSLRLHFKSGEWSFEDVVPGKTARRMFKAWLQGFPRSFHPSDMERLDFLTISLFQNKSNADPHLIERYLVEDLKWPEKEASLVHNRIVVGLQVLAARRRYWRGG